VADKQVDILIIGGGLIGATFFLAIKALGYSALLVEAHAFEDSLKPDFDARSLALSPASVRILNTLNIWPILQPHATPIETIHVSQASHFGATRLTGSEKSPLGYVIEMQAISLALHQLLPKEEVLANATMTQFDLNTKTATIETKDGPLTIETKLLVAADGTHSKVRQSMQMQALTKSYNQQAVIANIQLERAHNHAAFERFTKDGPIALLPMSEQRAALIWTLPKELTNTYMQLEEKHFLKTLQDTFGYRLGRFTKVGRRVSYPLTQLHMPSLYRDSVVFIGNAANTLHPVAGQGFNLGLRDSATLAECIRDFTITPKMLTTYEELRKSDQKSMCHFTDGLISLFGCRLPGFGKARAIGLMALDNVPFLKNTLSHYARGFGGYTSDLVCERALTHKEFSE
jgi:2-octaprenyl-6-methoxyphenol hydroxylase